MQLNCEGVRLVWMCNGQNSWPEGRTRMRLSPLLIKGSSVCGCPEPTQSLLRGAEDLLPARIPQVQDAGGSNGLVGQGRGMIPSTASATSIEVATAQLTLFLIAAALFSPIALGHAAGRAFGFVKIHVPEVGQPVTRESFRFTVDKNKLQEAELRDGHYLLRSNLTGADPAVLWTRYVQLTQIESAFRSLKSELGIRPIYHHLEHRVDAHILIAFLAYCLQITLKNRLWLLAPGLTPTAVMEKLASVQMIDVWIPTVDGRWLILPRYTQPEKDTKILLEKLKLELPTHPPPRISANFSAAEAAS